MKNDKNLKHYLKIHWGVELLNEEGLKDSKITLNQLSSLIAQ